MLMLIESSIMSVFESSWQPFSSLLSHYFAISNENEIWSSLLEKPFLMASESLMLDTSGHIL
jgi:hypothetical protein